MTRLPETQRTYHKRQAASWLGRAALLFTLLSGALAGCSDARPASARDQADTRSTSGADLVSAADASSDMASSPDASTADVSTASAGVSVATFNVRRFFDTVCDSGECAMGDFEAHPGENSFNAKADLIVAGIRALDADVILLQEIESQACMDALASKLDDDWSVFEFAETGWDASLDVGVISRGELIEVRGHRANRIDRPSGGTTTFARELFEAHLQIGGAHIIVFAAHFISQVGGDDDRRLAEANAAREIVTTVAGENPGAVVILGGDLNDDPSSPVIQALESGSFLRVAAELGEAEATYDYRGDLQALDHIFLAPGAAGRYIEGSAKIFREANRLNFSGSDHAALRATFSVAE